MNRIMDKLIPNVGNNGERMTKPIYSVNSQDSAYECRKVGIFELLMRYFG